MPKIIVFDQLTDVRLRIRKDPSGQGQHEVAVCYAWLATNDETRPQPELNIFPWLRLHNPPALAQITAFYDAVVQAVLERDGLA